MLIAKADTPTHRATISELTLDEIDKLVEEMRERRMRQHNAYQLAQEAKAKLKYEKDKNQYEKLLIRFDKKYDSACKAFDACSKMLTELKALELVLGE